MTLTHSKKQTRQFITQLTRTSQTQKMEKAFWAVYQFYIENKEPLE